MAACDLLLRGGHVIDPKNDIDGPADVAIDDGTIHSVGQGLTVEAKKTVDVDGLYVTPGLIDMHLHAYGGYEGWLFPDQHCLPHGVTTCLDTGGPGWKDIDDCIESIVKRSKTRVFVLVNIVGAGMTGKPEQDVTEMIPEKCAEAISKYPDHCIGSKSAHFGGPGWEATGGAIEAARMSGTLTMIDFAPKPTRTYQEMLERLDPGDIHTHLYASHIPLLDDDKQVNGYVREARERGVIFDLGHGGGSFWFRIAKPAMEQGFPPDTISTDLHKSSRMIPNAIMPATMSKMLALGMPLTEVIYRSTQKPAEVMRHPELGHLTPGACADVAVLDVREGQFGFVDSGRARMSGTQRIECEMTVRDGRIVWDLNGRSRPEWSGAGDYRNLERDEAEAGK
jgi:dihydroorotase